MSRMSRKFVTDARAVVRAGAQVRVRVLEVDLARKRIALTMRLDDEPAAAARGAGDNRFQAAGRDERARGAARREPAAQGAQGAQGALAAAFARLRQPPR